MNDKELDLLYETAYHTLQSSKKLIVALEGVIKDFGKKFDKETLLMLSLLLLREKRNIQAFEEAFFPLGIMKSSS